MFGDERSRRVSLVPMTYHDLIGSSIHEPGSGLKHIKQTVLDNGGIEPGVPGLAMSASH
jgi:hypothetical protein